ncbi:MAG: response regulator [Blastocatellia bacterium]
MRDSKKNKKQLILELKKLRQCVTKLSKNNSKNKILETQLSDLKTNSSKPSEDNLTTKFNPLANITTILEAASLVAVIITDINGVISIFNSGAEKMLAYTSEEVLGKELTIFHLSSEINLRGQELSHELYRKITGVNVLTEYARQGKQETREWTYIKKNNQNLTVNLSVTALKDNLGNLLGFLSIATDISEQKQVHKELQKAKETAEMAVRVKSEFLANMSHEIRTPMNAVIGMTGLLLDTSLSEEQKDYVATIRSSGDALLTIINDILDFSKIEAGKLQLEQAPFDIKDCIEESLVLIAPKAAEKGLNLTYSIDPLTPRIVLGDIARLRQILVNLLSNAVKFTKIGEVSISVKANLLEQSLQASSCLEKNSYKIYKIQFSVKDNGIGIAPDRVNRLFQAFSQLDTSTTRKYGGTGLGLAISKLLCELMGGNIWVESQVGSGATFHFTILAKVTDDEFTHGEVENILVDKQLLMIVDDPIDQYLLQQQTVAWGMHPRATTLVDEAIYWLRDGSSFDIVVIDTEVDNYQLLLNQLKENIPLLTLVSPEKPTSQLNAIIAGSLTKPFNPQHLYEVFTNIFSNLPLKSRHTSTLLQIDYEMALKHPLRILVAEDNVVNQKVTLRMLEKMGYRADIAANGLEVLHSLARQNYDVILMDLQMPEMDGLTATREIRQNYTNHKPRIIAMTASVMQGDRENCLEAGMDDYISKPVKIEQLQAVLKRCYQLPTEKLARKTTEHLTSKLTNKLSELTMLPPIDLSVVESLLQIQVPGEPNLLLELIDMFVKDAPKKLDILRNALQQSNFVEVRRIAHTLKGSSGSLGANQMMKICAEMEQRCKNNSFEGLENLLLQLEMEFIRAESVLLHEREKIAHLDLA